MAEVWAPEEILAAVISRVRSGLQETFYIFLLNRGAQNLLKLHARCFSGVLYLVPNAHRSVLL